MTKLLFSFILCLVMNVCFSQTQFEINQNADIEYRNADKALNAVYQKILKVYKADTEYIKNLKVAQRIWIQFRDAEMKAKYPEREAGYYGSIHPMCWSIYLKELTEDRINKLQVWLTGTKEGDSCSGSIKINK